MFVQIKHEDFMELISKLEELETDKKALSALYKDLFEKNSILKAENSELKSIIAREKEGKASGWYFYGI